MEMSQWHLWLDPWKPSRCSSHFALHQENQCRHLVVELKLLGAIAWLYGQFNFFFFGLVLWQRIQLGITRFANTLAPIVHMNYQILYDMSMAKMQKCVSLATSIYSRRWRIGCHLFE